MAASPQRPKSQTAGLLIALAVLSAVGFLVINFKIDLDSSLAAGDAAFLSQQLVRLENRLNKIQPPVTASAHVQIIPSEDIIDSQNTSISPWYGLGFSHPWSKFKVRVEEPNSNELMMSDANGLGYVQITANTLVKYPASKTQKTSYAGLVFKQAGTCDVFAVPGDDCGAAFYYSTTRNTYKIISGFAAPLPSLKELQDPTGKKFYASLSESDL